MGLRCPHKAAQPLDCFFRWTKPGKQRHTVLCPDSSWFAKCGAWDARAVMCASHHCPPSRNILPKFFAKMDVQPAEIRI